MKERFYKSDMEKDVLWEIKHRFEYLFPCNGDMSDACAFVQELLEAEADYIKKTEPYATNTIKKLDDATHTVMSIGTMIFDFE